MSVDFKDSVTRENLMRAFAGESQARNRYTIAANQAEKQDLHVIYAVFDFTAEEERKHAEVFYNHLSELGGTSIRIDGSYPVDISQDVAKLLRFAQHNEYEEHDDVYLHFAEKLEKNMPSLEFGYRNNIEHRVDVRVMYGGLLFIGIFFGMLFMICLLVIMHYKQITEGYEDRDNFEIMQKVGMGHEEVHKTIAKQVLLVFFLPIFGAVCHTMAAVPMTSLLMSSIGLYSRKLIVVCCASILCLFFIVYGISYLVTAKAYMRIVERKGN